MEGGREGGREAGREEESARENERERERERTRPTTTHLASGAIAPAASLESNAGTIAKTRPCHTAVGEKRSETGIENATVAEKNRRSNQRLMRLHCLSHTRWLRGTSQKSNPATKDPTVQPSRVRWSFVGWEGGAQRRTGAWEQKAREFHSSCA